MNDHPPSPSDIAAAERVAGIAYTDAERTQMAEALVLQITRAQRRRAFEMPLDLAPASVFDPRLPGFGMPLGGVVRLADTPEAALPAEDADIAFASLADLSGWIRSGALSSERLTRIYLERIARLGPMLECIALATPELALAQARAADTKLAAGEWLGPLHGIPYGCKDLLDTADLPTRWGAEPYLDRVPASDSAVVRRLAEAGAVLVAKTSLGALAYGDIWHGGRTRNPWNLEEGSSGSSAGSGSGVAAGLFGFAIGTETLGSIMSPAARCGTAGLRPTFGRVSRAGAMALCWSLDKIGPMTRFVGDTALVLEAINGPDARDPGNIAAGFSYDGARTLDGLRVGYFEADMGDALDRSSLDAAHALGVTLVPLQRADLPYETLIDILYAEAAAAFEELTLSGRDDLLTWQEPQAWPSAFRRARFISAVDLVQLDRLRRLVMREADRWFETVDVILGGPNVGPMGLITNFTGHPCLALPSGFREMPTRTMRGLGMPVATDDGPLHRVPHAVWLWGRLFDEAPILRLGQALEQAFGVAGARPPGCA
jgi:Asp-tRNA(Asn)/Glu-tRNA(Gln) amidotransferase A subunit family amidase